MFDPSHTIGFMAGALYNKFSLAGFLQSDLSAIQMLECTGLCRKRAWILACESGNTT